MRKRRLAIVSCAGVVALGLSLTVPANASVGSEMPKTTTKPVSTALIGGPSKTRVVKMVKTKPVFRDSVSYKYAKSTMTRPALGKAKWPKVVAPKNDKKLRCTVKGYTLATHYNCKQIQKATNKPGYKSFVFTRYVTSASAKASKYTWGKTTSALASLSASIGLTPSVVATNFGLTSTSSTGYNVTAERQADRTKFSKLSIFSGYYYRHIRVRSVGKIAYTFSASYGAPGKWTNTVLKTPNNNQFMVVVYL